ncbi:hypothetical protein DLD77_10515 [Chitinophaga alhagiae]|uniref:Uncharacterized protein n=1 Tax=Chitinophaga alhagiae TaxID=2203219 RepID=A0ABM6WE07_9BACT|nr:hypothetical protein [Chitinophaga alhagiae]AWO02096.1 hypothetical protein DLD77_10515 [Chitinophaga alhagiae]
MRTLIDFVTVQLSPEALVNAGDDLPQYREKVRAEKLRITCRLLEVSCGPAAAGKAAFIQALQMDMVRLLDVLYYYRLSYRSARGPQGTVDGQMQLYRDVEDMLHEILIGLEQHFPECLSPELPLPFSYAARARRQLQVRADELAVLLAELQLDEALLELVLRPVRQFLLNPEGRLSFRSLAYYRELLSQLYMTATLQVDGNSSHLRLHAILIHLNFNAIEYYLYCINRLRAWLKGYRHLRGRITGLTWCIKEIRSIPVKSGTVALHPGGSPIAAQLYAWLEEERIFLRNVHEENLYRAAGREAGEKLQTSLTVSQLALMLRIYIEEGIIIRASLRQVLFFVSGFVKVRKPDAMVEESFEAKYDNPSLSTITACKLWVGRLMERLNDHEKKMRAYVD